MRSALLLALASILFVSLDTVPSKAGAPDPYRPSAIATEEVPIVPASLWDRLRQNHSVRSATFSGLLLRTPALLSEAWPRNLSLQTCTWASKKCGWVTAWFSTTKWNRTRP